MPKIVDKNQKRKQIALACQELIYEIGIRKITVEEVAKTAGIGKGTVYQYFENKDDIVFQIINIHIENYYNEFMLNIKNLKATRDKIFYFFKFVIDESIENKKHLGGYKEYLSIVLSEDKPQMKDFNDACYLFFKKQLDGIIKQGIDKNELIPQSINFVDAIMHFEKGVLCAKMIQNNFDVKKSCDIFVNNLFDMLEIKKD